MFAKFMQESGGVCDSSTPMGEDRLPELFLWDAHTKMMVSKLRGCTTFQSVTFHGSGRYIAAGNLTLDNDDVCILR
jgi:hypothetical protein